MVDNEKRQIKIANFPPIYMSYDMNVVCIKFQFNVFISCHIHVWMELSIALTSRSFLFNNYEFISYMHEYDLCLRWNEHTSMSTKRLSNFNSFDSNRNFVASTLRKYCVWHNRFSSKVLELANADSKFTINEFAIENKTIGFDGNNNRRFNEQPH